MRILLGALLLSILISACISAPAAPTAPAAPGPAAPNITPNATAPSAAKYSPSVLHIRSAHFENSAPGHGDVYATAPKKVVLNFNFNLASPSEIRILYKGADVGAGDTKISSNFLAMERNITSGTGDGEYIVNYTACWPDRSCHKGQFSFGVDSTLLGNFTNLMGQAEVTMDMKNITFEKQKIIVSRGTKVTWTNRDSVDHFVNSDSHPSHNFINVSSLNLKQGQNFSYTFNETGEFHYHCSAHVPQGMNAIIIVR